MKKYFVLLALLTSSLSFAQPGMRPSGGGDGNGRPNREGSSQQTTLNLESSFPKGNSKIIGFVIDSAVTIAVEYASVVLIDQPTQKTYDGAMADDKGKFEFTKVAPGKYDIKVTFIGYKDTFLRGIEVKKGEDLDIGVIKLPIAAKVLDEVTITGLKSLIEEKVDRLVYNAENDQTSKGGDGADVLRKVPMLSVDLEGNVQMRGSSNIQVLINNKPSTIVASSVADALRMIPAELIKTVEVITSPSAKYDAEGTAGIINIITKRSSIQGYNLNINTGVGLRGSNLSLSGNLRVGKVGFSLGGYGRGFYNRAATELNQQIIGLNSIIETRQTSEGRDFGMFGRYNLGMDIQLSDKEYITGGVSFGTRGFQRWQDLAIESLTTQNREVYTIDRSNNVDVNVDYVKIFKPGQEWSISTLYSQNNLTNNFTADIFGPSSTELLASQKNINANVNQEITAQTDYVQPIGKNQQFEVGLKGIYRVVNSDFNFLSGIGASLEADARNPSGFLNYNQNIQAGYLSYTYSTKKKWSFKAGLRYENTVITANDNRSDLEIAPYDNLVPSVNISKIFGSGLSWKLAYNNRIQRPGLQQLNPNFNIANPQDIQVGNPNLEPEISNNVEMSFSKAIKRSYVNISVFARQINNGILRITSPNDTIPGALITTFENIGKQQNAGINFFGNINITQNFTLNGGFDAYYTYLEGQVQTLDGFALANNSGIVIGGRMMGQLNFKNGYGIQAFGGARGNDVTLQGFRTGFFFYSLGLRKDFKNGKGNWGIGFDNFFGGMTIRSESSSEVFSQQSVNYLYNQNIKFNFSYKLGNMKFVERKKTKGVNNTDVKGGGDSNQGFN